jgi:hypothetical protein
MRRTNARSLISVLVLVLLVCTPARTQQPRQTIDELKQQIDAMEKIDRDPSVTPDVKAENIAFLGKRKADLVSLLQRTLTDLQRYKSVVGRNLTPDESDKIDRRFHELEQDLHVLSAGSELATTAGDTLLLLKAKGPSAADVSPSDSTPSPNTAALDVGCPAKPDDLIKSTYLVASSGAPTTLFVELTMPLSLTQDSDVTIVPPAAGPASLSQLSIPQNHFQIVTEHGTSSKTFSAGEYQPAETKSGFGRKRLDIKITGALSAGDTDLKIKLINLRFDCSSDTSPAPTLIASANKTGTVYDAISFDAATKKEYDAAIAAAKSPDRKAFSAGFAAAKGDGSKAQGAGDFLINKNFSRKDLNGTILDVFDQVNLSFQVKKSTAQNVDPRYLNLGLDFRKTFLIFTPKKPTAINGATAANIEAQMQTAANELKRARNKGFFRVAAIGGGVKLEGEAFDFKTVNFVADPSVEIGSIAKRIGSKGYYNVSFIGGGEIGRNLSKPDAGAAGSPSSASLHTVNWIARLMGGGQMTLRYLPTDDSGAHWGVELNMAYAMRHLFQSEVFTDTTATGGKTSTVRKGNQPWRQADLKFFLFGDQKARYGFKFSYMNGALPPAFTRTKGFQYGFIIETSDDKTNGQAANK